MRISHLFDDPLVKALCEAAERDEGDTAAIATRRPQGPITGAAAPRRLFLAAGPASRVFDDLAAAARADRALEVA